MGKLSLTKVKDNALKRLDRAEARFANARSTGFHYTIVRWIASMTAVEVYAAWERYAEMRLTVALAHHPTHFITDNSIRGIKIIPGNLAAVLVRAGGKYFDFRSCVDLIDRGRKLLGKAHNPFEGMTKDQKGYLDTLSAIRNYVVHQSDSAIAAYKRHLSSSYGIKLSPEPDEFLNAIDNRRSSPCRYRPRINGLVATIRQVIANS